MSALARSTAGRSVHLKVHPRPRSIADTKVVLNILRQFGDVEMFKHLKHEAESPAPNSFLAIFRQNSSASRAVDESYIQFEYGPTGYQASQSPSRGVVQDIQQPRPASLAIRSSQMNHEMYISRQPYYARYPRPEQNSLHTDMSSRMPPGLYAMSQLDYGMREIDRRRRTQREEISEARKRNLGEKGYLGFWEEAQASLAQKEQRYSKQVENLTANLADDSWSVEGDQFEVGKADMEADKADVTHRHSGE